LVEGQAQGGGEEDYVLSIPPLEEENVLIDMLHEGDRDPFSFCFDSNDLYHTFVESKISYPCYESTI